MTTAQMVLYVLLPTLGYLLGSVPFAFVIGKIKGVDIRTVGSKNIGATNLGRTLGPKFFWYAFLLDAAKGFLPVLVAALYLRHITRIYPRAGGDSAFDVLSNYLASGNMPSWAPLITAIACVVGHLFPVWLKFKGGKGVATGFGVVLGFWPLYTLAGILAGGVFVLMLLAYRYISLASMIGASAFAAFVALLGAWPNPPWENWISTYQPSRDLLPLVGVALLFAIMIILRHRTNITRLRNGTERKIGQREVDKAKMGH